MYYLLVPFSHLWNSCVGLQNWWGDQKNNINKTRHCTCGVNIETRLFLDRIMMRHHDSFLHYTMETLLEFHCNTVYNHRHAFSSFKCLLSALHFCLNETCRDLKKECLYFVVDRQWNEVTFGSTNYQQEICKWMKQQCTK